MLKTNETKQLERENNRIKYDFLLLLLFLLFFAEIECVKKFYSTIKWVLLFEHKIHGEQRSKNSENLREKWKKEVEKTEFVGKQMSKNVIFCFFRSCAVILPNDSTT